jgi:adenosylmethionine-8-amino-7-oxononanoate aminotransferase
MAIQYWWNKTAESSKQKAESRNKDQETRNKKQNNRETANGKRQMRNKVLAFNNAYHGDTFGAMSVSDRSVFTLAFHDLLFEVIFIDTPAEENIAISKKIILEHGDEIAAFIYEPLVQGAGGMKMYDAALLDELLFYIKQKNIVCIADEVMTGFGRTGKMFASEYLQTKPDIICLSKGLTGGTMALGVTACSEEIYNAYLDEDVYKTFFHGHSFTANPLACTAALANLDLFETENTFEKIAWISEQNTAFAEQLKQLGGIKNVRTLGTILAFEITRGKDEYINNISQVITKKCLERGVYIRPLGNTVYIMPPYCIVEEELQKIYSVICEVI